MSIGIDIADRLYDYTDEECAANAVAKFQDEAQLDDAAVVAIWNNSADPRRVELERRIFEAVDENGSTKRARDSVPGGISLFVELDE